MDPFDEDAASAARKFAFLLDCVCLRRSQELLQLPNIIEKFHYITLSEDERLQYDETTVKMANYIREKANRNSERRDPFGIFQAQLQLRLLCNHGTFQKPFSRNSRRDGKSGREDFLYSLGSNAEIICSICGSPVPVFDVIGSSNSYKYPCGHKLCQECVAQSDHDIEMQINSFANSCQLCAGRVGYQTAVQQTSSIAHSQSPVNSTDGYFNQKGHSSKIAALIDDLQNSSGLGKR